MIKRVAITFDFDTETEEVSNVKTINSVEAPKKRTTTKKIKDEVQDMATEVVITLESNKLIFNSKAVAELELEYEDRIVIKWISENKVMIPLIGKDIAFDEEGTGNKVTKSNTITYKGKANTILAAVGNEFTISPYKDGIWKLISKNIPLMKPAMSLEEAIEATDNVDLDLLVDTDDDNIIDELQFKF